MCWNDIQIGEEVNVSKAIEIAMQKHPDYFLENFASFTIKLNAKDADLKALEEKATENWTRKNWELKAARYAAMNIFENK